MRTCGDRGAATGRRSEGGGWETLANSRSGAAEARGRQNKMMVRGEIGVGARSHHELVVVLQQERPLGGVQGRGDLLRGDGEILGDLRVKEGRVRVSAVKSDWKTHVGAAVEVN